MSFFHSDYIKLISALRKAGRQTCTVFEALDKLEGTDKIAILRHDVDRFPNRAVALAKLEHTLSIKSTYYFRCNQNGNFPKKAIETISILGHEVGFHYECLSRCNGQRENALSKLKEELESFRALSSCQTIAAHGSPMSKWNNMTFLANFNQEDLINLYNLKGDAVHQMIRLDPCYLTDTGGSWNKKTSNFRDYVGNNDSQVTPDQTEEFTKFLATLCKPIYISTHPERWNHSTLGFLSSLAMDKGVNFIKMLLTLRRTKSKPGNICQ